MGHDFSRVRVHEGRRAERLTDQLGAEAFTVGRSVVLRRSLTDAQRNGSLAHELAHVVQLDGRDGLVLRQARAHGATVGVASTTDRREFVQSTIHFFESASDYFANVTAAPAVDRVLRQWQQMVAGQGQVVLTDLGADPALFQALRAAYQHALTTLIDASARLTNQPATALYERHRSLIPEWAFPTRRVVGITSPLPTEAQVDRRGRASVTVGRVHVVVAPDGRRRTRGAETTINFSGFSISSRSRDGRVVSIRGPAQPVARIQTVYGRGTGPAVPSAYGRGTTQEDVAAGTPTLGFHEGSHGRDYLRFLREHPYPQFTGAVGMSTHDFNDAVATYRREVGQYARDLTDASLHGTDCVGTTIDQDNADRGVQARIQCN
jgi:uncharacterized protein DUF4157